MMLKLIQLCFTTIVVIFVLIGLLLDALGYAEGIHKHLPWLGRAMKNRIVLCMLVLFALGFLAKDFHDSVAVGPAPPPLVVKPPPPPPMEILIVSRNASSPVEASDSLRRRTLRLADALDGFNKEREQARMAINATRDESGRMPQITRFDLETSSLYVSRGLKEKSMEILQELRGKGLEIGYLDAVGAAQSRSLGWDEIATLRALAYRLDSNGNVIRIDY